MQPIENADLLVWPQMNSTASIIALVLALAIFFFGYYSGVRANRTRVIISVLIATAIGIFTMPYIVKIGKLLGIIKKEWGVVILLLLMMIFITALAVHVYEIITVTTKDIGLSVRE
jgi:hypothetical protein